MRVSRMKIQRSGIMLFVMVVLVAAASNLSFCEDKEASDNSNGEDDQGAKGSFISAEFDSTPEFKHTLTAAELSQNARNALVSLIDASPAFQAAAVAAGSGHSVFEDNDTRYRVRQQDGSRVNRTYICEDDENFTVAGTYLGIGKSKAIVLRPSISASPSVNLTGFYELRLDLLNGSSFVKRVDTVRPLIIANVISAMETALTTAGFSFTTIAGGKWEITKSGDYILGARVEVTDTWLSDSVNCVGLDGTSGPDDGNGGGGTTPDPYRTRASIPALADWGMAALAGLLVLGAAFLIYRRQRTRRS